MVAIINPCKRTAMVYCPRSDISLLPEQDVLDGGDVVPGWQVPVRDVCV